MAQTTLQLDQQTFSCSICLELLRDPVALACGHSYCMECIETHWGEEDEGKLVSCPQCRKSFTPRPVLVRNTIIAAVVEQLKKTELQAAPADLCYAGPEDVACDICTGRKRKALKSCLRCLVSYCEKHLQPHYHVDQLKKHQLVEPSKKLQENICPQHDEVMKMFCRTHQKCICYLCSMDDHKGHNTVSVAAERKEKQRKLELSRKNIQQKVQDRQKDVKLLQKELKDLNHSADETLRSSKKIFSEMMRLLEQRERDVEQQVRSQQQTEVSRVKELEEQLEQEITELKRRDAELEQLSHTQDHTRFLLSCSSLAPLGESADSSSISIRPLKHFEDVAAAVSELRDGLQDLLRDKGTNITLAVAEVDVLLSPPPPEPRTREEFLKYSCELTLDPNTAERHLLLSEENRRATYTDQSQSPHHPDRFTEYCQVLSRESLTGRSYWEVEWRGDGVDVAVTDKDISRSKCFLDNDKSWVLPCDKDSNKFYHNPRSHPRDPSRFTGYRQVTVTEGLTGHSYRELECRKGIVRVAVTYKNISRSENFGDNDKSWALYCCKDSNKFYHNNISTSLSGPRSSRIGVYLDHRAGVLSFYRVSETMTLLHRVQTSFTQTLYAGLYISPVGATAEFCDLKKSFRG